jgi:NAD(P)H-dependent flavin oxidoreductase YrpB (nitropropane dioxygenase family)
MAVIQTALTRLLAIEHPIMLAPMGSAAGGKLAAAVTNAGGLGIIGSGQADACSLQRGVRCEPDLRGRIPSMTVGDFANASPAPLKPLVIALLPLASSF